MRLSFLAYWILFSSQFLACQDPVQKQPDKEEYLWSAKISSQLTEGEFPKFLHKNTIICHATKQGNSVLIGLDKGSGKELWQWNDKIDGHGIRTIKIYQYQNILVWRFGGRVYGINLDNGQTIWKEFANHPPGWSLGNDVAGLGNRFLFYTSDKEYFSGNTNTGNIRQYPTLATPRRTIHTSTKMFLNAPPNLFENAKLNDTIAVLPFGIPITGQVAIGFTVFNLTQNKEIYTKTIPGGTIGAFGNPPILQNSTLYFDAGPWIHAFDLKTGNQLWRERFPSTLSISGILYHDGMIIGNCEDTFMYALNATTGKQLWATKTSGTSSRLFEMNGVIYFTGGGDGLLHAIDAKTGTHIWKKESPDLQRNGGAWFFDSVTGADGKIYVSSYLSLFCYKAAR